MGSSSFGGTITTRNFQKLIIGNISDTLFPGYFNGTMDEVMIWNRTLSAQEIGDLYEMQEWRFNKSGLLAGTFKYNVTHIDAAGNKKWTLTRTVYKN